MMKRWIEEDIIPASVSPESDAGGTGATGAEAATVEVSLKGTDKAAASSSPVPLRLPEMLTMENQNDDNSRF